VPLAHAAARPGLVRPGRAAQPCCPVRRARTKLRECPCAILPFVLVFERQRVGCVRLLTLKGVLGIAVEFERSLLTAENLRTYILTGYPVRGKTFLAPLGGDS
jgi:hypothetical protein